VHLEADQSNPKWLGEREGCLVDSSEPTGRQFEPETAMLGTHDISESTPGVAPRGRAATRTLLAITTAAAAFFAVASAAQAQDCVGGFRMIKDEIPIACGAAAEESAFAPAAPLSSGPATTGSISRAQAPSAAAPEGMSPGGMKCVGGYNWRPGVENSYTTLPMACDRM
jgi:hypothetical protein